MKLSEYKKNYDLTYRELSTIIDIPTSTLHRICGGSKEKGCIKIKDVIKIINGTEGQVTLDDLLPSKETAE